MKTYKNLYKKLEDIEFIKNSIKDAARHKTKRKAVAKVLDNLDYYSSDLQKMLLEGTFKPTKVPTMVRWDSCSKKYREINPPVFYPDQCVHWVLINLTKDIFMKGMYRWNCGNVPGRGTSCGVGYVKRVLGKYPKKTKYCLYMDIHHYYQSIDHDKLIGMLKRKISDKKIIDLFEKIIKSNDSGLPLGNYTSQWLANFYLQEFDHLMKEKWGAKFYCRNVDDMVVIGSNKRHLHKIRKNVQKYLAGLGLELKPNYQVYRVDVRGIDYLGCRFYHDHTSMRKRNYLKLARNARKARNEQSILGEVKFHTACGLISRNGIIKQCNHHDIYKKNIGDKLMNECKESVIKESKKNSINLCERKGET